MNNYFQLEKYNFKIYVKKKGENRKETKLENYSNSINQESDQKINENTFTGIE